MNERNNNDPMSLKEDASLRKQWHQNRHWLFLAFHLLFVPAFFGPMQDLVRTSLSSEYDTYIPLIPFISAYLMYLNRKTVFSEGKSFSLAGLFAIVIGTLFLFAGRNYATRLDHRDYLAFIMFSSVTIWIGGFIFFYGVRTFRAAVFPLLFLYFIVPIPSVLLERVILILQTGSAEAAYGYLKAVGVPIVRDGFVFHLPTIDLEVAKQCSGIRSALSLVITGALACYFFLRTGWTRTVLLMLLVPIAVIKNGFRIASLSILGVYVDERVLDSNLHKKGGFLFFILALVLVWAFIVLLRKAEGKTARKDAQHRS